MMMEIEKNVELPPKRKGRGPGKYKYPFPSMEVGDSFVAPITIKRLSTAANNWTKRNGKGRRFTCRTVENGTRCWRVE
jgi:hypothetical protein